MPHLSVIVPTYNSSLTIAECLKAIRGSDFQDYELIIADGASQDTTCSIAKKYANTVLQLSGKLKRSHVRKRGAEAASGSIIVNIDSDIVIRPDTLSRISQYFSRHSDIYAATGLLSKEHPHKNFFSQYKNLYMNYVFGRLPEKITFLYGSIYAFRRYGTEEYGPDIEVADDTAFGQHLTAGGKNIGFIKDLEVIHMKRHDLFSFIKNDFRIPFDWANIFMKYKGFQQLFRNKTGFAHSPKEQLLSVALAPVILLFGILSLSCRLPFLYILLYMVLAWLFLNVRFFVFLYKEKGIFFTSLAIPVTFIDNIIMFAGIICGFTKCLIKY